MIEAEILEPCHPGARDVSAQPSNAKEPCDLLVAVPGLRLVRQVHCLQQQHLLLNLAPNLQAGALIVQQDQMIQNDKTRFTRSPCLAAWELLGILGTWTLTTMAWASCSGAIVANGIPGAGASHEVVGLRIQLSIDM